ncbi:MAG: ImmA/IrrE family metallo-endopeptidase, partial [Methylacidiphilales bacterium]|nr:ImmA/IrrE family metallo-endopeptidase [Candidatus Methylacidiphilales bacterium]
KANVHAFAEKVASKLGFGIGEPLEPIVARLGGRLKYRNPEGDHPESIAVEPDGRFTIWLPTMTTAERDRFTIAHELGHYFLHFPLIKAKTPSAGMKATRWVSDCNPQQQRAEWEANWFAAAFLMPATEFRKWFTANGDSVVSAAARFAVSTRAAEVRAASLGLR